MNSLIQSHWKEWGSPTYLYANKEEEWVQLAYIFGLSLYVESWVLCNSYPPVAGSKCLSNFFVLENGTHNGSVLRKIGVEVWIVKDIGIIACFNYMVIPSLQRLIHSSFIFLFFTHSLCLAQVKLLTAECGCCWYICYYGLLLCQVWTQAIIENMTSNSKYKMPGGSRASKHCGGWQKHLQVNQLDISHDFTFN